MMDTIFSAGLEKKTKNRNYIVGLESSWFLEADTNRRKNLLLVWGAGKSEEMETVQE